MNRLREGINVKKREGLAIFTNKEKERVEVSFNEPKAKEIIPLPEFSSEGINDSDTKIKLALAHDNALDLLTKSINYLRTRLDSNDVKVSAVPGIMISSNKVISDIRKERLEREKARTGENIHYHFYCPNQRKIDEYEVIDVSS